MPSTPPAPSVATVESIIALNDQPVLRNLKITQCYHDLSRGIASLVGQNNANWCTFATWASKTAGRFVHDDTLSELLLHAFHQSALFAPLIDPFDQGALREAVDTLNIHITKGNLKVFKELGPLFAKLVVTFHGDAAFDATKRDRFLDPLRSGATKDGGQDLLRSAISHLYKAMFEADPDHKAEEILLANAQTGLHEQIRLQSYIKGALNAPIEALRRPLPLIDAKLVLLSSLDVDIAREWRGIVTGLMEITLPDPDEPLQLGVDLRPPPGRPLFPPALQQINDNEIRMLLQKYGALGNTSRGSGAADWADLHQRMCFILTFFRSWQQYPRLFEQPFTDDRRREIDAGRIPKGEL